MVKNNQQIDSVIANLDHIKQVNYATIYKVIEKHAPISRVKIAKISKLAPASVTKITRQLLENGVITESGNALFSTIQQCVAHQALPEFQNKLKIVATELQPDSTIAAFALIKQAVYEGDWLQKIRI